MCDVPSVPTSTRTAESGPGRTPTSGVLDIGLRLRLAQHAPRDHPVRYLNLIMTILQIGQTKLGIARDAQKVGGIELYFSAAALSN